MGISKRDKYFLTIAVEAAKNSECRMRHGAVLVKNGNVLGVGINKMRNHPSVLGEFTKNKASYHAEVVAASRVPDASGAVLYSARVWKDGTPAYARPCDECQQVIDDLGIKRTIYTIDERAIGVVE